MIRQNAFNNLLKELSINSDEIRDIATLLVAHKLANDIHAQGADLRMGIEGQEISISDFSVNGEGELMLNYHLPRTEDDRRTDHHQDLLRLGFGLDIIMNNTWYHQPPLDTQPTPEDERDAMAFRTEPKSSRRSWVDATRHMGDVDLQILRELTSGAQRYSLELMRGFWATETKQKQPKRLEVNSIVYNLYERDRLNAAWEVRAKGLTKNQDYELIHLRTGAVEPAFSGDYGTEQEWIKAQTTETRVREQMIYNDDESDFMHKASAYIAGKYRTKSK